MTPKQKAEQLIDFYAPLITGGDLILKDMFMEEIKGCALIAVFEIIKSNPHSNPLNTNPTFSTMTYWQEVKQEIEKL
jgi:hypothetical protein